MANKIRFCLLALALASTVQPASARPLILTKANDIADQRAVSDAMDALVERAQSCRTPGMACACSLRPELARLSAAYHSAVTKHPVWKEPDVMVQYVDSRHITHATAFYNVKRQLDACHVR